MFEKRIYGVVALTVQAPMTEFLCMTKHFNRVVEMVCPIEVSIKTIVQPPGRIAAQHGHAVSMARESMFKDSLAAFMKQKPGAAALAKFLTQPFTPFTTIVLAAADSFELYHVLNLLSVVKIPVHAFYDTNQSDYGDPEYRVLTAIATEPVNPEDTIGVLDYLPLLWKE